MSDLKSSRSNFHRLWPHNHTHIGDDLNVYPAIPSLRRPWSHQTFVFLNISRQALIIWKGLFKIYLNAQLIDPISFFYPLNLNPWISIQ